jgi:integrase
MGRTRRHRPAPRRPAGMATAESVFRLVRRTAGICASAAQREPCQNQEGTRGTGQGRGERMHIAERATARVVCRRAQIGTPTVAAYLQTLLLTGARPGEVLALRWEDVNTQWKGLTIRDKVEGRARYPFDALRSGTCWPPCPAAMNGCLPAPATKTRPDRAQPPTRHAAVQGGRH